MRGLIILSMLLLIFTLGCQQSSVCAPGQEQIVSCVDINDTSTTALASSTSVTQTTTAGVSTTIDLETTQMSTTTVDMGTTTQKSSTTTQRSSERFDAVKEYKEGDLVSFSYVKVVDPDNDKVTIRFSKPLDEKGEWQTKAGDAGDYIVTISASDGKTTVEKKILVRILPKNHAPKIDVPGIIRVKEGQTVKIKPKVTDVDNDKISIRFLGWMTEDTYETNYDDAGEHYVTIIASDGKTDVVKKVKVIVENVNRAPVIEEIPSIKVKEGETVTIKPEVSDPDNDKVTIKYESPLSKDGVWKTKAGDAGTYNLVVSASDGEKTVAQKVKIIVEKSNNPPVIMIESPITVDEGDTIKLSPKVSDPDGDTVSVSYSGWMTKDTYETTYDDAGEHKVTITATDGKDTTVKEVTIIVNDKNRPPEFII